MTDEKATEDVKLPESPKENINAKRDFYIELALFLILGILVGIAVKNEADKRITIGFDDYQMKTGLQQISINKLQSDLIGKLNAEASNQDPNSSEGAVCTNDQPATNQ